MLCHVGIAEKSHYITLMIMTNKAYPVKGLKMAPPPSNRCAKGTCFKQLDRLLHLLESINPPNCEDLEPFFLN